MTPKPKGPSKIELIHALWRRGNLSWKCHAVQKEMYDQFYAADRWSTLVWLVSRQTGKSVLLSILALEQALREPNSIVKLVTDTKVHVKTIFEKIFEERLIDCPPDIRPEYNKSEYIYYFKNGSQIQFAGTDGGHYEKLRGGKVALFLIDEAGFCKDLDYIIKSVAIPTLTHTGGNVVLASTPPFDLEHEFLPYIEKASMQGKLTKKNIYDNPLLNKEQIEQIKIEMGGEDSEAFQREWLCKIIKSSDNSVFPEFDDDLKLKIVKEWPLPPFFDSYVGMDLGGRDLTGVLFGYYDFRGDRVIIEDELLINFKKKDENLEILTNKIIEKEALLWTSSITGEVRPPLKRVSDINYLVTQEIYKYSLGKITFSNAKKDDNEAAVNNLRVMIANKKVIIHPRCVNLIRHLEHCKWNNNLTKADFARSAENGHYDLVKALQYMVRSIDFGRNPYPEHYGLNLRAGDSFVRPGSGSTNKNIEVYKKIFNIKGNVNGKRLR